MDYEIIETEEFAAWFDGLRDMQAKFRIARRVDRLRVGNPGDVRPVGLGISEMRIDYGPGYRVYFVRSGQLVFLLLCGGDKSSQQRDIATAKALTKGMGL